MSKKPKLAIVDDNPYLLEFFADGGVSLKIYSSNGYVDISMFEDYKTKKISKSDFSDLKAFHKTLSDMVAWVEKHS